MISLHQYAVGIVSSNPLVRKILPHILGILGQENIAFHASLYDAAKKCKDDPTILIFDTPKILDDLFLYQDKLNHTYLFVIDEEISANTFSAEECLDAFNALNSHIFGAQNNASLIEDTSPSDFCSFVTFSKEDLVFKHPNPPKDMLTVYKLENPLTMRGVVQSFKAILPQQTVPEDQSGVTYTLLEKDLRTRLKAYDLSLRGSDASVAAGSQS